MSWLLKLERHDDDDEQYSDNTIIPEEILELQDVTSPNENSVCAYRPLKKSLNCKSHKLQTKTESALPSPLKKSSNCKSHKLQMKTESELATSRQSNHMDNHMGLECNTGDGFGEVQDGEIHLEYNTGDVCNK